MNRLFLLLAALAALGLPASAALDVNIKFSNRETNPGDGEIVEAPALRLMVYDSPGKHIDHCINTARSSATNAANWTVHFADNGSDKTFAVKDVKLQPAAQPFTTMIIVSLAEDVSVDDMKKDGWRVEIKPTAAQPALTVRTTNGSVETVETLDRPVTKMSDGVAAVLSSFQPFEKKFDFGGGDEGALFGLSFTYRTPVRIAHDNDLYGFHVQFDGSVTPNPDDALRLYGRYQGEAGFFRSVELGRGRDSWVNGSLFFDANTRFESDQQADNYNYTVGAGVWGFLGVKPLAKVSQGIYWITNLGQREAAYGSLLTFYAGYDFVAASEHDAQAAEQGENRARFVARYRTPLWHDVDLPVLPTTFDVDGVADYTATWDFQSGKLLSEVKATVEFIPKSTKDDNLAFTLSYVSGKISPTFVDEEAFLAGLRWRF